MIGLYEESQCDLLGRLFVLSGKRGLTSEWFISTFLKSDLAKRLEKSSDVLQWADVQYIYSEFKNEHLKDFHIGEDIYNPETLYWIGYVYRYWNYTHKESFRQILRQAKPKALNKLFYLYHTMSVDLAIQKLKEIYQDKTETGIPSREKQETVS